jgi:hypothetical protein
MLDSACLTSISFGVKQTFNYRLNGGIHKVRVEKRHSFKAATGFCQCFGIAYRPVKTLLTIVFDTMIALLGPWMVYKF